MTSSIVTTIKSLTSTSDVTLTETQSTSTTTITTILENLITPTLTEIPKRDIKTAATSFQEINSPAILDPRDIIVAKGRAPAYATGCKDVQAYVVACICLGVKAVENQEILKTKKTLLTIQTTSTIIARVTETILTIITDSKTSITTLPRTVRVTRTETATATETATQLAFGLRRVSTDEVIDRSGNFPVGFRQMGTVADPQLAFSLGSDNQIYVAQSPGEGFRLRRTNDMLGSIGLTDGEPMNCLIDEQRFLKCTSSSGVLFNEFYYCLNQFIYFGIVNQSYYATCVRTDIKVEQIAL